MADRLSDTFLHGKSSDVRPLSYLMADRLSESFPYGKSSDVCLSFRMHLVEKQTLNEWHDSKSTKMIQECCNHNSMISTLYI